jgi:hypothetical protein
LPPSATTTKSAEQTLAEQYELDTGAQGASVTAAPGEPAPVAETSADAQTPGPTPEPTPAPEAPARDASGRFVRKGHPAHLVRMAKDLGFSEADINDSNLDLLQERVYYAHREALAEARGRQAAVSQFQGQFQQQGPQARQLGDLNGAALDHPGQNGPMGNLPHEAIDESQYDPGLIALIKQHSTKQAQRIEQLESTIKQMQARNQARWQQTVAQKLDSFFATHPEIYGAGQGAGMQKNGREYLRRRAAIAAAEQMQGTIEERIAAAHDSLFGTATNGSSAPSTPPARPAAEEQAWAEAALARPTNRAPQPEPNGRSKAIKSVSRLTGQKVDFDDTNDLEGFL